MGGRVSCICDQSSRKIVIVIKENGELLKFKEYIRVKDILAANPYHKIIRYTCSATAAATTAEDKNQVLPDSFQLSCNRLYFLLPREIFLTDETYANLLRLASRNNSSSKFLMMTMIDHQIRPSKTDLESNTKYYRPFSFYKDPDEDDKENKNLRWKPALQTIPEVNSPLPPVPPPEKVN